MNALAEQRNSPLAADASVTQLNGLRDYDTPPSSGMSVLQVETPDGGLTAFESLTGLRDAVLRGEIGRQSRVRVPSDPANCDPGSNDEWCTVEALSREDFALDTLYHPVGAHLRRGLKYGILTGIGLKALDTAMLFFAADPTLGLLWLGTLAAILFGRFLGVMLVVFLSFKLGFNVNFFVTALAVAAVGTVFGAPVGLLIGTAVGYLRRTGFRRAPDAEPEGLRPFALGMLLPGLLLGGLVPAYLALNEMMMDWLESAP